MVTFIRKSTKQSLLTMLRKADKITPRLLARLFEGVLFKDEYETFSAAGGLDHGDMGGLADDDHVRYVDIDGTRALTGDWDAGAFEIRAETLESDVGTGTAPLTIASETMVDNLNADLLDGYDEADFDYTLISGNDADTDVTGAELEELTDESSTTLHSHDVNAQTVCMSTYTDVKARNSAYHIHGHLHLLDTAHDLDAGDLTVTAGISKIILVINTAADPVGDITITGTIVDRDTGAETAAYVDTIPITAVTTDASDTDASSNARYSLTGAYISSHWFKGSIVIASTDTTVTDMDTYQCAFEQCNDSPNSSISSWDISAHANNASAWMYAYLYLLDVTGSVANVSRVASIELPAADVSANTHYRLRRGNLGEDFDGTTDGLWFDMFPGPLASAYWEDINTKVWVGTNSGETTITGYEISGTITGSPPIAGVTVTLTGDYGDSTTTDAAGEYAFSSILNGSYTVTPTKTGYTFVPVSIAVTVYNADQTGKDFVGTPPFARPYVENFEGAADVVGDNEAALEARSTHYDIYGSGATVQLDDYDAMPAIVGPSFTKCITSIGTDVAGQTILVSASEGFTPPTGGKVLLEGVFFISGIGGQIELWARDADESDGILAFFNGTSGNFSLDTVHSGNTRKVDVASGLSSSPMGNCWVYFGAEYNLGTDAVKFRLIEFGSAGATQEDTGWVSGGTVSSPTFDTSEWIKFEGLAKGTTAAYQGFAQLRVCDSDDDGYGLGEFEAHNYQVP